MSLMLTDSEVKENDSKGHLWPWEEQLQENNKVKAELQWLKEKQWKEQVQCLTI